MRREIGMFTGKPIVINGGFGLGKLLAGLIPQELAPLQPSLPYSRKEHRNWGPTVVACFVFPILFGLTGLFLLQLTLELGVPAIVPGMLTFLIVSLAVYKMAHCNIQETLQLTETEMTLTPEHVQWVYRRPFSAVETRTIPLTDFLGLRFEVHEITRTQPTRYTNEFYYLMLVHPQRELSITLFGGPSTQHIPYMLQEWAKLLPVPTLEPNELAKERISILVSASRNRAKPIFQL